MPKVTTLAHGHGQLHSHILLILEERLAEVTTLAHGKLHSHILLFLEERLQILICCIVFYKD